MVQQLVFLIFVFVSCIGIPSAALLPSTRGKRATRSRGKKSQHPTTLLCATPTKRRLDWIPDKDIESITSTRVHDSESLTRQVFLSSICSRFGSILAVVTGVANSPQLATANESDADKILTAAQTESASSRPTVRVLSVTLRSLPVSGCWAAPVTLSQTLDSDEDDDFYTYLAVVDTGSPFLTAPMDAFSKTNRISTTAFLEKKNNNKKQSKRQRVSTSETDITYEQYGTTIGSVEWRMAPYVTLVGNGNVETLQSTIHTDSRDDKSQSVNNSHLQPEVSPIFIQDQADVVLGIPSQEVVAETGGIFLGLMTVDAARPTPLQQLGYDAFAMRFGNADSETPNGRARTTRNPDAPASLVLWSGKQSDAETEETSTIAPSLIDRFDPYSMKLFDLTPYGPNLHHYGVLCDRFECWWGENDEFDAVSFNCGMDKGINSCSSSTRAPLPGITLSRPLVAVFDTGLSGCIFSDTLWEEIQLERQRLKQYRTNRSKEVGLSGSNLEEKPPIGCTVWLPTIGKSQSTSVAKHASTKGFSSPPSVVKLSSISKYWRFQSFRLPWWYSDKDDMPNQQDDSKNYPHVVVLGSAFWRNPNIRELAVDTGSQRAKIATLAQRRK